MSTERDNAAWLNELSDDHPAQAVAVQALRGLLLRGALFSLGHSQSELGHLAAADVEALAEDCAQEALLAVLAHLPEFRGESKFTTWAYKFAVNIALTAARRERWKGVSLDDLLDEGRVVAWPAARLLSGRADRSAEQAEVWEVLREVIDTELTARQRQVLRAIVLEEVPLDEVVRHLGSNRNAVYKLLHDARCKLKDRLEARGYAPGEILQLFAPEG
jgi:RNA polymerase sigma-70 factor (ECF subfamily)